MYQAAANPASAQLVKPFFELIKKGNVQDVLAEIGACPSPNTLCVCVPGAKQIDVRTLVDNTTTDSYKHTVLFPVSEIKDNQK